MAASQQPSSPFPPASVRPILEEVASLLRERKETVSVAETVAGGIISASLLSVEGASSFFKGGLTLYTLDSRLAYAGWTPQTIQSYRGPTPVIVADMASHVRNTLASTYTVSESGTAGPTGGVARNRMPGYVALAVACADGRAVVTREVETGCGTDREANMVAFAVEALTLLRDVIRGDDDASSGGQGRVEDGKL